MATLGENIKKARIKKGITQEELATALNTTKATISRYELGKREPRSDQLKEIAKALNVTVAYLEGIEVVDVIDLIGALQRKDYRSVEQIMNLQAGSLDHFPDDELDTLGSQILQKSASELNINDITACIREHFGEVTEYDYVIISSILKSLSMLNEKGQSQAVFRIDELTAIPWYRKKKKPPQD